MTQDKTAKQIDDIRQEIRETPYHKGTEHHIGLLRAKLSRLRDRLYEQKMQSSGGGTGFMIKKAGDANCLILGPPSSGKSSLVNTLTNAKSRVGVYGFTTVKIVPGMMNYRGALIQLLDAPGIIESGFTGRGGGRQILSAARAVDLVLVMSDIERISWLQETVDQLKRIGIRLNLERPGVEVEKRARGGIEVVGSHQEINDELVKKLAVELGIKDAFIVIKENPISMERLIDGLAGNRLFLPAVFVINKVDKLKGDKKFSDDLRKQFTPLSLISTKRKWGLDKLRTNIWRQLGLARVFLKKDKTGLADKKEPLIVKKGASILEVAKEISGNLPVDGALVWGKKVKFSGQRVSVHYQVSDEDEIFLICKKI